MERVLIRIAEKSEKGLNSGNKIPVGNRKISGRTCNKTQLEVSEVWRKSLANRPVNGALSYLVTYMYGKTVHKNCFNFLAIYLSTLVMFQLIKREKWAITW